MAGCQPRPSVGKLERHGRMQRDFRFTLQELKPQTSHLYRDSIGEYSRFVRSQNLDISAISLNVHLEWVSGYRQNNSLFSQSYVSILLPIQCLLVSCFCITYFPCDKCIPARLHAVSSRSTSSLFLLLPSKCNVSAIYTALDMFLFIRADLGNVDICGANPKLAADCALNIKASFPAACGNLS